MLNKDDDVFWKYNTIWKKVGVGIKKEFHSEPVCNRGFLKTKTKSHGDKVTDFYDNKNSNVEFNHTCLAVITVDSAPKNEDNYYK